MKTMEQRFDEKIKEKEEEIQALKTENESLTAELTTTQEALDFILMSMEV